LTDCALGTGVIVTFPDCGETYWSEDGHPAGTLCPKYGDDAQPKTKKAEEPSLITCPKHNV